MGSIKENRGSGFTKDMLWSATSATSLAWIHEQLRNHHAVMQLRDLLTSQGIVPPRDTWLDLLGVDQHRAFRCLVVMICSGTTADTQLASAIGEPVGGNTAGKIEALAA